MQHMLVLIGPQGCGKSSACEVLAGPFFGDSAIDIGSKDAYQVLRCSWIHEWAELEVLKRARDAAAIKSFLTSATDTYRPPYGRLTVEVPRSGVIVGTTNEAEFLVDDTGARRFWPVSVGQIDLAQLTSDRDQLWAEAVAAVDAGEQCVLPRHLAKALEGVHRTHEISDAWAQAVLTWAEDREDFTTGEALTGALEKPKGHWTRSDEMRVASILTRAGFTRAKTRGVRSWRR